MGVTKSQRGNIFSPEGNSLAVYVDDGTGVLSLKDINGVVQPITDFLPSVATGVLQLENGVPMDTTLRKVSDQNNTTSPLLLSTRWSTNRGNDGLYGTTAFGENVLGSNAGGGSNTAFGVNVLNSNTTGGSNTGMGTGTLNSTQRVLGMSLLVVTH